MRCKLKVTAECVYVWFAEADWNGPNACICVFSWGKNPQHGKNVSNCVDPISSWPDVSEPIRTENAMGPVDKNQRRSTN